MEIHATRIVPHGTFLTALLCLCAPMHAQTVDAAETPVLVTMASDVSLAKEEVQLAMRDMLMGWNEMASVHLRTAVHADPNCALAWCGLMVTDGPSAEARTALERIFSEDIAATPQESALLSTWLRLIQGGQGGAGEEFAERAAQFRADSLSTCWAVVLLHDSYDEAGKALPNQQRALELIQQLYARKPQDALISFLRAWVEESSPSPSDAALEAARFTAEALPRHPAAQLLYGHLLFRRGQGAQALPFLQRASDVADAAFANVPHGTLDSSLVGVPQLLSLRANLYESTVLCLQGEGAKSLKIQQRLLNFANSLPASAQLSPSAALLHWEARTLPLRLLMLHPELPTDAQIAAAVKLSLPARAEKNDPVLHVRDCLRFCLVARQRAATGKQSQALRCIRAAEKSLELLEAARERCAGQGSYVLSAWSRADEACRLALLAAKAASYPDTADIWLQSLEHGLKRPTSLLMPPVLPK